MTDTPRTSQSEALYRRALKVMPGGVSRNTVLPKPHPLYAAHASGCRITAVDSALHHVYTDTHQSQPA